MYYLCTTLRYDVHYKVDDAMQPNVREDKIRATKKTQKKKRATPKKKPGRKRAAESNTDMVTPKPKKKRGRPSGSKNKKKSPEETNPMSQIDFSLDEGDPPWRTTGHDYLLREIMWTPPSEEGGEDNIPVSGTVVAFIADTDVDSEGNPGFISEKTGKPANLFHVIFDEFDQDFEEWEIEECFVEE